MRIGIFGGTFDPIHRGHTTLAQAILAADLVDSVWLMVSPQNPFKVGDDLLDESLRLSLARLAVRDVDGLEASDFEFSLPRPSYTYITMERLSAAFPQHTFSLVIGGDNWEHFPQWRCADLLLEQYPVIVYPRADASRPSGVDGHPHVTFLADAPLLPISSTQIRRSIAAGNDVSTWLDPAVAAQIHHLQLYR